MRRVTALAFLFLALSGCIDRRVVTWAVPDRTHADCFFVRIDKDGATRTIAGPFCGKEAKVVRDFIGDKAR